MRDTEKSPDQTYGFSGVLQNDNFSFFKVHTILLVFLKLAFVIEKC